MVANQGLCEVAPPVRGEQTRTENGTRSGNEFERNGSKQVLTKSTINPHILGFQAMEYAARGPVITRAIALEQKLAAKKNDMTCNIGEVVKMNLGDAHAMGQKPISFVRQVLALLSCPELLETSQFNEDVKQKARELLSSCRGGSAGSYSDSRGMQIIRRHVAEHLQRRDQGVPANPEDIILSAGASEGIRACLKLLKSGESQPSILGESKLGERDGRLVGVLTPVPEYPLYSATLEEYNMKKVAYYLDETAESWCVNVQELETRLTEARDYCVPRAIVVINPGNPTGHVLSLENMEAIVRFAFKENLVLIADEVYQDNVYLPKRFISFKSVVSGMPVPYNSVELISVHSCSKGYVCECGLRAGFFEVVNMDPEVKSVLTASVAANLCPTVLGQAVVDCLVDPPKLGDPSYESYIYEKSTILNNLAERARLVQKELNAIPGVSCSQLDGAMYAFPKISLPEKAIAAAKAANQEPDVFYCLQLLESTGICVVPGSGMGQKPGTYHFRTTILASTEKMKQMLAQFRSFHLQFTQNFT